MQGSRSAGTESGLTTQQGAASAPSSDPEFFRLLFEFSPDAILAVDLEEHIFRVNTRAEKLFGYGRDALIGEPLTLLIPSEGRDDPRVARRQNGSEFPADFSLSFVETNYGRLRLYAVREVNGSRGTGVGVPLSRETIDAQHLAAIVNSANDAIVSRSMDGTILSWNPAAERMFGWTASEVVGRHYSELDGSVAGCDSQIFSRIARGEEIERYESTRRLKDGSLMEVAVTLSPIKDAQANVVGYSRILRDLTDRTRAREKEVLLQEIHHRVKNSLAVISSLFFLQSTYTHDPAAVEMMQESQDRVRAIALVHETLYSAPNFTTVNFADYARSLAAQLLQTYRIPGRSIRLSTDLEAVEVGIDRAGPCGLILNELITNSLKHGFLDTQAGEIRIALKRQEDGMHLLEVADNGAGFPGDIDPSTSGSLGLRLIRSLARQLDGSFEMAPTASGAVARLKVALTAGLKEPGAKEPESERGQSGAQSA